MAGRRLEGRTALITGGESGIGQATAIRFAEEGADVAINYLKSTDDAETTEQLVQEACDQVHRRRCRNLLVQADVSKEDQVRDMFKQVLDAWEHLDILVNNAGIQLQRPSHELAADDFDKVVAVNLRGAYLCAREALRHFKGRQYRGVILNNSSVHEVIPKPQFLGYSASKGGLRSLTRTLALEYAADGIRVNAVAPGVIVTPMNQALKDDPGERAKVERNIPMRRAGDPDEIAAALAFLASDEASYITGQTLFVDGGLTCYPGFEEDWSS